MIPCFVTTFVNDMVANQVTGFAVDSLGVQANVVVRAAKDTKEIGVRYRALPAGPSRIQLWA